MSMRALNKKPIERFRPSKLKSIFPEPRLFPGESKSAYQALSDAVEAAVGPKDTLEEIWTGDTTALQWQIDRLRRGTAHLMWGWVASKVEQKFGAKCAAELLSIIAKSDADDASTIEQIKTWLSSKGTSLEQLSAAALEEHLDTIERMDDMISRAEGRRNAHLSEIQRHRAWLASMPQQIERRPDAPSRK